MNQSRAEQGNRKYICITKGVLGVTTDKTQKVQIQDIENFVAGKLKEPGCLVSSSDKTFLESQLSLLHNKTWKSLPWFGFAWIGYLFMNKVGS